MKNGNPVSPGTKEDNTVAILGYLTIIGFAIALIMHNNKRTELGAFHLRQALGINLLLLLLSPGWNFLWALYIIVLVFLVLGLISAINGERKELPFLGKFFQDLFRSLG